MKPIEHEVPDYRIIFNIGDKIRNIQSHKVIEVCNIIKYCQNPCSGPGTYCLSNGYVIEDELKTPWCIASKIVDGEVTSINGLQWEKVT